ncbi:MAG: glycoside-pentoside-hexuronide (GPH):cation symporter [Actinomycetaceae bacterium]|nr:glycoside-pentoside-hexuronide (GPH):cation symporter [Actinomycetaceae bacterium]
MSDPTPSVAAAGSKVVRPFGIRDKVGYLFGDFGNDFSFLLASSYLMIFYTDVLGIGAGVVGWIFFGSRIVDAFTDVGMGRIVDTLKPTKAGRFRPWILRGMVPVAVASFLLYQIFPQSWGDGPKIAWAAGTYLLWGSITYTMINIPYGSMAAVISDKPEHRASLSVFRSVGAQLAFLLVLFVPPFFIYKKMEDGSSQAIDVAFPIMAAIFAGFSILWYFLCYRMVTERIEAEPKPKEERASFGQMLLSLVHNRGLLSLVLAALLLLAASLLAMGMTQYLYKDYFGDGKLASWGGLIGIVPVFILAPFASTLAKKFGKRELGIVGMLLAGGMNILLYVLHLSNPFVFMALFLIQGAGLGLFNILIWAFITDVLDYQEVLTHQRDDGTIYAVYSWARKLGQAFAGGLTGWALQGIGYQRAEAGQKVVQEGGTIEGIYALATIVPGLIYLACALVLWFFYPLSKKVVDGNVSELQRRRDAAETA